MPASPHFRSLEQEILYEGLDLHARVLRLMPGAVAMLLAGLAIMLVPNVPPARFGAWAALCLAVEAGRCAYAIGVRRHLAASDLGRVHRYMVFWAALSGSAMGMAGPLFHPLLPVEDQVLVSVTIVASVAASIAVSMATRYIIGVYAVAVLVPLCVNWGLMYRHQIPSLMVFATLFTAVLMAIVAECERMLGRSVSIRRERADMVRNLERSNTKVRQAVARAEREASARSRALAAASHDLRPSLHALSIYSAVLAANPSPQSVREVGGHFDQIVRALGALLHGLIDLSQLSFGHYVVASRSFAADRMLASVCAEFESLATAKGLVLEVDLAPLTLVGDAMAISRVARNLIDHALRYTERGTVSVRLRCDGRCALLTVTDTGDGIVDDQHAPVSEAFSQVENPGRDLGQGDGLGLAIVQRLVELIDARITLRSQAGRGTRFEVRIPGAEAAAPADQAPRPREPGLALAPRHVPAADEEDHILRSFTLPTC